MNSIVQHKGALMPQMTIQDAVERYNTMNAFISSVMREGTDFDTLPGTAKPTLHKPGAEKLCSLFGLSVRFVITEKVEDWTGKDHNGEAFFYYAYRCLLWRGESLIAESDGSCNSWEKKYRWRSAERVCPHCQQAAIIKGKKEFGGGWICFNKKGGCGAKFAENDPAIVNQETGRIPNPDIADLVNTIQKMAQKRAFVGSTLIACNASEYFTQDLEDGGIIEIDPRYVREMPQVTVAPAPDPQPAAVPQEPMIQSSTFDKLEKLGIDYYGSRSEWEAHQAKVAYYWSNKQAESIRDMTETEALNAIARLEEKVKEKAAAVEA